MDLDWLQVVYSLGPRLYRFFMTRQAATAEDLVQEVFVRILEKIKTDQFQYNRGSLEAYAWGIAVNLHKEEARAFRRLNKIEDGHNPILDSQGPLEERKRDLVALAHAVDLLREPMRSVMQMVMADLRITEISLILEMPEGTIKSHIHRAKELLTENLKQWGTL